MAKQIKRTEIAEEDLFKGIRDSADKTLTKINELNSELKESATLLSKDIKTNQLANTADINKFVAAVKEAQTLQKQAVQLNKSEETAIKNKTKAANELKKIEAEKLKTDRQLLKERRLLNTEEERAAKAAAKTAKAVEDEKNEYKKLVKATREQKNESKRLAVELIKLEQAGKRNSKEYKKLAGRYREVTKAAQKGDKTLKKIDKTVGDNFRNVGNYSSALGKLRSSLAQLGLAFGAFTAIRGATRTVVEFDQAVANLVSITGAGGKDLEFFKEQAREIGTNVEGGATAVIEAYQLIGSARPELLKNADALNEVTKSAITLSQASGLELPDAAQRLTDAMNQFNVPVSEAGRVIDVLANASLEGSALIPEVTDAMLKFGAAANSSNVSVEESAALIETLASKGLKGAEAGTALRNVMLKLSAPNALPKEAQKALERLGISFEDLNDTSKPFSERLEALKPLLNDSAALQKVFGKENAIAATNLISLTGETERLTEAMKNQGTATKQAEQNTNTIAGAFTELENSFDNLVLEMNEGAGIGDAIKNALFFLAENLETIVTVLFKATRAFLVYKGVLLGLKLKDRIAEFVDYRKSIKQGGDAIKDATPKVKNFGRALKGIGLSVAISLLIEAAMAFWDFASGAEGARKQQELFNLAVEAGNKRLEKITGQLEENYQKQINLINERRSLGQIDAKEQAEQTKAILDQQRQRIQGQISALKVQKAVLEITRKQQIAAKKGFKEQQSIFDFIDDAVVPVLDNEIVKEERLADKVRQTAAQQKELQTVIDGLQKKYKELGQASFDTQLEINDFNTESEKTATTSKKINTEFKNQIDLLSELRQQYDDLAQAQRGLQEVQTVQQITEANRELTEEIEKQTKASLEGGFDFSVIMDLSEQRKTLEQQAIIERRDFEIQALQDANALRFQVMREQLETERQELIKGAEGNKAAEKKIELNYQSELRKIDALELDAEQNLQTKIVLEKEKANNELINLEIETNKELEDLNEQLVDNVTGYAETKQQESIDKQNKADQDLLEKEKQRAQERIEIINAVADFLKQKSDERIALIDREIQAAEEQQRRLERLAENGNIKAEQSLAEQERIQADRERAKLEEEQRQQRIELARVALTTYNGKVEAGSQQPLAETIRDISLLQQFINTLPAFLEGTEDTGANGQGVDGKGGFHAILHPNERVLTKDQNAMVGGLTNNELAKVASEYNTGKLIRNGEGALMIGNGWDSMQVIKQLENVQKAIENQPSNDLHIENVVRGAFDLVKSNKKGNTLIYNRYRLKN